MHVAGRRNFLGTKQEKDIYLKNPAIKDTNRNLPHTVNTQQSAK